MEVSLQFLGRATSTSGQPPGSLAVMGMFNFGNYRSDWPDPSTYQYSNAGDKLKPYTCMASIMFVGDYSDPPFQTGSMVLRPTSTYNLSCSNGFDQTGAVALNPVLTGAWNMKVPADSDGCMTSITLESEFLCCPPPAQNYDYTYSPPPSCSDAFTFASPLVGMADVPQPVSTAGSWASYPDVLGPSPPGYDSSQDQIQVSAMGTTVQLGPPKVTSSSQVLLTGVAN